MLSWTGQYDQAIAEYGKALEADPSSVSVKEKLARVLVWTKEYARAEKLLREVIAAQEDDTAARTILADILGWQGRYGESIAEYETVLAGRPDDAKVRAALAQVAAWNKDYPRAAALYREIIEREPENVAARTSLGEMLLWQRRYPEAIGCLRELAAERPGDTAVTLLYGKALLYAGDYDASRAALGAVIAAEPANAEARALLADSYAYAKQFKRAIELYREALAAAPDRQTRRKLADTLSWDRQYDAAIRLYDELLDEEEDGRIRLQKARVTGWARRYPEALAEYGELARRTGDPLVALEREAKRAYWDGRTEGALGRYRTLIARDPENVEAMFDLAQIASYQAMWDDALGEYRRILALTPNHFRAQEGLAKARLIAERPRWTAGYTFFEADSQSRDMDIRRHTIANEISYPVTHHIVMDAAYKFTARTFADFPAMVENEERLSVAYNFGPRAWLDGYYDLIAYNRDVAALNTFGAAAQARFFDAATVRATYDRERLENSSTVIRGGYYRDAFKERLDLDFGARFKAGADYLSCAYSDGNRLDQPGFDLLYYFSLDPLRLALTYRFFYQEFQEKVPEYFSPKGFMTNSVALNWRHYLNKEEIFFGADDLYYDVGYTCAVDSETIVGHQFTGALHYDVNKRLALDIRAGFSASSNTVYRESGVRGTVRYYF